MALVFQDGFDVWGNDSTSRTNMLNSSNMWVSLGTGLGCTTTNPRTGTHSLRYNGSAAQQSAKHSLGAVRTNAGGAFGIATAFYPTTLPSAEADLVRFLNVGGSAEGGIWVLPSGALRIYRGPATTALATSASGVIVAGVYNHIEIKMLPPSTYNATDGTLEVRVNNQSVVSITGTDLCGTNTTATAEFDTAVWVNNNSFGVCYWDDFIVWDASGSYCNDWLGNKAVHTFFPDADTATADWSVNGVTQGFDAINDATPDGDTTYLAGTVVSQVSIFEIPTITSTLTGITATTLHTVSRQDSAGPSQLQVALGLTTYSNGTDRVVAYPTYTAYQDHFYTDPDGAGAFTPTLLSNMRVKLTRTV